MKLNKNFIREMTKTPDPIQTPGVYCVKPYYDKYYNYGMKRWRKVSEHGQIRYKFDAVWFVWGQNRKE